MGSKKSLLARGGAFTFAPSEHGTVIRSRFSDITLTTFKFKIPIPGCREKYFWPARGIGRLLDFDRDGRSAASFVANNVEIFSRPEFCYQIGDDPGTREIFKSLVRSDEIIMHDRELLAGDLILLTSAGLALLCRLRENKPREKAILGWLIDEGLITDLPSEALVEELAHKKYRLPADFYQNHNGLHAPIGNDARFSTYPKKYLERAKAKRNKKLKKKNKKQQKKSIKKIIKTEEKPAEKIVVKSEEKNKKNPNKKDRSKIKKTIDGMSLGKFALQEHTRISILNYPKLKKYELKKETEGGAIYRNLITTKPNDTINPEITTFYWRESYSWLARGIGRILGYQDDGKGLNRLLRDRAGSSFQRPQYVFVLDGDNLAEFKNFAKKDPWIECASKRENVVGSKGDFSSSAALFLSPAGLALACRFTGGPIAAAILAWLQAEGLIVGVPRDDLVQFERDWRGSVPLDDTDPQLTPECLKTSEGKRAHAYRWGEAAETTEKEKYIEAAASSETEEKPEKTEQLTKQSELDFADETSGLIDYDGSSAIISSSENGNGDSSLEARKLRLEEVRMARDLLINVDASVMSEAENRRLNATRLRMIEKLMGGGK